MPSTGVSESGGDLRSTFRRFVCRYVAVFPVLVAWNSVGKLLVIGDVHHEFGRKFVLRLLARQTTVGAGRVFVLAPLAIICPLSKRHVRSTVFWNVLFGITVSCFAVFGLRIGRTSCVFRPAAGVSRNPITRVMTIVGPVERARGWS